MAYTNGYSPTLYSEKDLAPTGSDLKKLKGEDFANTAGTGDFDRIKDEFVKIQTAIAEVGTTRGVFASLTYRGGPSLSVEGSNNIAEIAWPLQEGTDGAPSWRFARVQFRNPIPGNNPSYPGNPSNGQLDVDVNIQVTPFAAPNNSLNTAGFVSATVTNIDKNGCEIAFTQKDANGADQVVWYQAFCLIIAEN